MSKTQWMKQLASEHGMSWQTVQTQMRRGYCKWPRQVVNGKKSNLAYGCWASMVDRCSNPNRDNSHRYYHRGIKLYPRWLSFDEFLKDVGPRPSKKHSLDRIDPDGNYEPGNVRWATQSEQTINSSKAKQGDITYGISKHGRQFQITRHGIRRLFRNMEEAIAFKQTDRS